jgi:hypothetical protein
MYLPCLILGQRSEVKGSKMRLQFLWGVMLCFAMLWSTAVHAQQPGVDCEPVQGQGWTGCAPVYPQQQFNQTPAPPPPAPPMWSVPSSPPVPPSFAAFAAPSSSPDSWANSWGLGTSSEAADQIAVSTCQRNTGKPCRVFGSFKDACGIALGTQNGPDTVVTDRLQTSIARKAIDDCERANHDNNRACFLLSKPICVGASYRAQDSDPAGDESIEHMNRRLNQRKYWGVIASNGGNETGAYGYRDPASARAAALSQCAGCRIMKTFQNTCVGMAWLGQGAIHDWVEDQDPKVALLLAQKQCSMSLGQSCAAAVRCSSADRQGIPFATLPGQ